MDIKKWTEQYHKFISGEGAEPPILVLIGESGSGKSRLLESIAGDAYYLMYRWDKESLYCCQMGKNSLIEIPYSGFMKRPTRMKILNQVTNPKIFLHVPYEGIREMKRNFVPVFTISRAEEMPYEFTSDSFFVFEITKEIRNQLLGA